jgi:hypothetical protein
MSQGHKAVTVQGPGEFLVEFRGSMIIEQEMARRLHSDLKCYFLC